MKLLNIGCGKRYRDGWVNIDLNPASKDVIAWDVSKGLPFENEYFDVVYHSHLLEHFSMEEAPLFLKECHRVLKHGGIIRVVTPNLEKICRLYLEALEKASTGDKEWRLNHEWMLMELFDQMVRERSGGRFSSWLKQKPIPNEAFVRARWGSFAFPREDPEDRAPVKPPHMLKKISSKGSYYQKAFKEKLLKLLLGEKDYKALELGRLKKSGELHLWMYDRLNLAELLQKTGFENPRQMSATESQIPNWNSYCLDTEADGTVYKPDSLYMEAIKK